MRRRDFITLGGAAIAWPLAVTRGQEAGRTARIGVIIPRSAPAAARYVAALKDGLQQLGYIEGQTLIIDWHFADGQEAKLFSVSFDDSI